MLQNFWNLWMWCDVITVSHSFIFIYIMKIEDDILRFDTRNFWRDRGTNIIYRGVFSDPLNSFLSSTLIHNTHMKHKRRKISE